MNARLAAVVTALETLVVVGIGLGLFFAPLSLVWALDDQFATDLLTYWRASADVWLLGHGVPVSISLGADTAASLGLSAAQSEFVLSVAPLGPAVLTLWFGFRMGRRDIALDYPVVVWLTGLVVLMGLSWAIVWSAAHSSAELPLVEAIISPSLFLATGLVVASWSSKWSPGRQWLSSALPKPVLQVLVTGVTSGIAAVAILIAIVSLVLTGSLVGNYATIIGLFESLGPTVMGVVVLFVGQLVVVPTLVVWMAAWFIGPGFQLGQAAQLSPLGTDIQALPAVPLLGALPQDLAGVSFGVVAIPVLAALAAAALSEARLGHPPDQKLWLSGVSLFAQPPMRGVLASVIATATAVLIMLPPALLVTGSLGPGRFATVGIDVPALAAWWAVEVAIGTLLGLSVGRGFRWIRSEEQRLHPPKTPSSAR